MKYARGQYYRDVLKIETDHSGNLLIGTWTDRNGVTIGDQFFNFETIDYGVSSPEVGRFIAGRMFPTLRVNVRDSLLGRSDFQHWSTGQVPMLVANPNDDGFIRAGRVQGVGTPQPFNPTAPPPITPHNTFVFGGSTLTDYRTASTRPEQGVVFAFDAAMQPDSVVYEYGTLQVPLNRTGGGVFFDMVEVQVNAAGQVAGAMFDANDGPVRTVAFYNDSSGNVVDVLFRSDPLAGSLDDGSVEIRHAAISADGKVFFAGQVEISFPPIMPQHPDAFRKQDVVLWRQATNTGNDTAAIPLWSHVLQGVYGNNGLSDMVLVEDEYLYAFCAYSDLSDGISGFNNEARVVFENVLSTGNATDTLFDTGLQGARPLIAKFDTLGNFLRFDTLGQKPGTNAGIRQAVYLPDSGQFLIRGYLGGGGYLEFPNGARIEAFFDSLPGINQDFVARIDTLYNLLWYETLGQGVETGTTSITDIAWGPQGVAYVAGYLDPTGGAELDFAGFTLVTDTTLSSSFRDHFVVALGDSSVIQDPVGLLAARPEPLGLSVYPNPAHSHVTLRLETAYPGAHVQVFNTLGKLMVRQPLVAAETRLRTEGWAPGVYHVQVSAAGRRSTTRLVVR